MEKETTERVNAWPRVRLGDVCEVRAGADYKAVESPGGAFPIYGTGGEMGRANKSRCPANSVIVGRKGTLNNPLLIKEPFWNIDTCFGVIPSSRILSEYLFGFCQSFDFYSLIPASGRPSTTSTAVREIELPLPPLLVQREIVARLEKELGAVDRLAKKFEELEAAAEAEFKATLKETFEKISRGGAETRRLGDVCEVDGKLENDYVKFASYPHIGIDSIEKDSGRLIGYRTVAEDKVKSGKYHFTSRHIIVSKIRPYLNKVATPDFEGLCSADSYPILPFECCDRLWLAYLLRSPSFLEYAIPISNNRAGMPKINREELMAFKFELPPLATQRAVVARLDAAKARKEKLVAAAKRGREEAMLMRKAILKEAFE